MGKLGRSAVVVVVTLATVGAAAEVERLHEDTVWWQADDTAARAEAAAQTIPAPGQLLSCTVLSVSCASLASVTNTMTKLTDVGTFYVAAAGATAIVTAHGRFGIEVITSGTGAVFEIRVDDLPPAAGRARPTVRENEVGLDPAVSDSATGVFAGLAAGTHTVSVWVRGAGGGAGADAMVDPGCWSADHIVVELYDGAPAQAMEVAMSSLAPFTTSPAKVADIGTFTVSGDASVVELTYNGRFTVAGLDPSATGAIFELRVDDQRPLTAGEAAAEIVLGDSSLGGRPVEISGVFRGLEAGSHVASIWVFGTWGGGAQATVNPRNWHDQLVVTEHDSASATALFVDGGSWVSVTDTMSKLYDLGSFEVVGPSSVVEVVFNGRVGVSSMAGTGVVFELRVDDLPTSAGRARASVKDNEAGSADVPAHMTALYAGLSAGTHTVSMWAQSAWGSASGVGVNRLAYESNHILVLEHGSGEIFRDGFATGDTEPWSATSP